MGMFVNKNFLVNVTISVFVGITGEFIFTTALNSVVASSFDESTATAITYICINFTNYKQLMVLGC